MMLELNKTLFLLALLILSGFIPQAFADKEINKLELALGDILLKPGNTLKLKALAIKENPELDINRINLLAIEVLAKSRQGDGKMRLRVGNNLTGWTKTAGSEQGFESKELNSFSSIKMRSPEEGVGKVWQLLINGYIKIRKITLYTAGNQSSSGGSV